MILFKGLVALALVAAVMGDVKNLLETCVPGTDTCTDTSTSAVTLECDKAQEKCLPKVDESCTTSNQQCVTGAACVAGVCKCGDAYSAASNLCTTSTTKAAGVDCTDGVSACTTATMDCSNNGKACVCKTGYTLNVTTGLCENYVGSSCTIEGASNGIVGYLTGTCYQGNSICTALTGGTCVCGTNYSPTTSGKTCEVTPNTKGGSCTVAAEAGAGAQGTCFSSNAKCESSVCKCKTGYITSTGSAVCKLQIGENGCTSSTVCVDNAACDSTTNQCKCNTGYQTLNTECEIADGYLTGTCSSSIRCLDPNAECDSGSSTCQCKTNYAGSGFDCKLQVGQDCTSSAVSCIDYATCDSSTNKCKCNSGYETTTSNSISTCKAITGKVGGACYVSDVKPLPQGSCSDSNANCTSGTCYCKSGYTAKSDATCSSNDDSGAANVVLSFLVMAASLLAALIKY